MKFKIDCKSILLQKALENFLKDYLDENGVVISDYNGKIIIGKDIKKPFSKSQLLIQLEKLFVKQTQPKMKTMKNLEIDMSIFDDLVGNENKTQKEEISFEVKLDKLIDEFSKNLKQIIKEKYDKK